VTAGPAHEGDRRTMNMHADEEADEGIIRQVRCRHFARLAYFLGGTNM